MPYLRDGSEIVSGMTDEEMAELTERLSGVPAASVLRALAVEYDDDAPTETETP